LQKIVVYVEPEAEQRLVAEIISELDKILRCRTDLLSYRHSEAAGRIDVSKRRIITILKQLADSSGVSLVLPSSLTEELFGSKEQADSPPEGA